MADVVPNEHALAARAASLRYVTDASKGISRKRRAKSFSYLDGSGKAVTDADTLARIRSLAIPPAWTDVWICPLANGHIQATGRDVRGRKQYRYHPKWRTVRDEAKYGRLAEFAAALPTVRTQVDRDLKQPGLPLSKVLAIVVKLLETTFIRVGNEEYARTNGSFGLTTLKDHHLRSKTSGVHLTFKGKSGKSHAVPLTDRRLAGLVKKCRDLPGQQLFQYLDENGDPHPIGSADVNDYLRQVSGGDFTAKDFRTWGGTLLAATELAATSESVEDVAGKSIQLRAIEQVATRLGNTPTICRKCYIHPAVLDAFIDPKRHDLWKAANKSKATSKGLDAAESRLLRYLTKANKAD